MAVKILPKEDATNGWSRILPPREPTPALKGDVRADWLVVGAGFAGLAAARRLAENRPDDHIVLLDAHEVGEGASGRNSGFAIDLPHNVGGEFEELSGAHGYIRLSRAAIDYLDTCVNAERDRVRLHPSRQVPRRPHRPGARENPGALRARA